MKNANATKTVKLPTQADCNSALDYSALYSALDFLTGQVASLKHEIKDLNANNSELSLENEGLRDDLKAAEEQNDTFNRDTLFPILELVGLSDIDARLAMASNDPVSAIRKLLGL